MRIAFVRTDLAVEWLFQLLEHVVEAAGEIVGNVLDQIRIDPGGGGPKPEPGKEPPQASPCARRLRFCRAGRGSDLFRFTSGAQGCPC